MGFKLGRDFLLSAAGADEDAAALKLLLVVREVADGDGARPEEAMAASGAAGSDAGDGEFQRLAVEYGDDPADRTNETHAVDAGPGHRTRPGEVVHGTG